LIYPEPNIAGIYHFGFASSLWVANAGLGLISLVFNFTVLFYLSLLWLCRFLKYIPDFRFFYPRYLI